MSRLQRNAKIEGWRSGPLLRGFCASLLLAQVAVAQLRIEDYFLAADGEFIVDVPASPTRYYVLYRSDRVERIGQPVSVELGQTGGLGLLDLAGGGAAARFYRVLEVPVTVPLDLDGDGIDDVYELGLRPLIDPLDPADAALDPDGDGWTTLEEYLAGTDPFEPSVGLVTQVSSSPDQLETGVSVNRETSYVFSSPLAPGTTLDSEVLYAEAAGRRLLTRSEVSTDGRKVSLFYLEPMPGGTRVRVTLRGDALLDARGTAVDADGNGQPGGVGYLEFETFGNQALASTAVVGQVFASELEAGGGGQSVNTPLEGVIITVDGAEETLRAVTDAEGRFTLQPAPAGRFFVHIDGRNAAGSAWPDGDYYPVVGKAWEAVPGRTDNLAGESGVIYLPLVTAGTLQPVSAVEETSITFPPGVLAANPELAGVEVLVPPNALFGDSGTRGGRVGIAPVAPDRIPSPLPQGLDFPLVITIQTDGPQNFDQPVPVRFPNLPDPNTGLKLGPGEKTALWSFNHDTGRWEIMGPMTVTADGNFAETDPGVGVVQPGWHGVQPGVGANGGPLGGPCGGGGGGPGQDCRQNPDFRPDDPANYNGCGPDGWDYAVPDNPNGLAFPCASFFEACKAHDIGYNTCGQPQRQTDDQFLQDMLRACECLPTGLQRAACRANAVLYHRAVTGGGKGAYDAAQDKACECEDPPPENCDEGGGPSLQDTLGAQALALRIGRHGPGLADDGSGGPLVPQLGRHRFAVVDVATEQVVQRGETGTAGIAFAELILAPHTTYDIGILQTATLWEGKIRVTTGPSGSRLKLPPIFLQPPTSWDFDLDGLHDVGELIMGTDYLEADSDGDGVNDGAEVRQGTNPMDGVPLSTGIIGTARTPGNAVDICAVNDLAVVAHREAGITLFNLQDPFTPILLGTVDTPGQARGVACGGPWIAVADGPSGLAVVDASIPSAPFLMHQVSLGAAANAVAIAGAIGYVGLQNGTLVAVDLRSGTVLERTSLGTSALQDVTIHGDTLYVLAIGRLHIIPLEAGDLQPQASLDSPGPVGAGLRRLRVFVAGGLAYATFTSGYNIIDVTQPDAPRLVRTAATAQQGWKQLIPNGSGLGVATVSANSTDDGDHHVSLYRLGPDGTQTEFLATFPTPGLATALTLYNGLAYVADGTAGIQVVNYLMFDRDGQPPGITLAASFPLDPPRAEEGKLVRVRALVTDDVQVRNVEFHVDGRLQAVDGNFEFETRFVTPLLSPDKTHFTLQARATDTGGNSTWTDPIEVELVLDATPPRVVRRFPRPGAIEGQAQTISATFNEPVDPTRLNAQTVQLLFAGPDGRLGTADDLPVNGGLLEWRSDANTVSLRFAEPLEPGLYQARLNPPLADLAGNPLPQPIVWPFWVLGQTDSDGDGVPDAIELALGLDPNNPDTNGNGVLDGDEDPDGDGLATRWELLFGLDPRVRDSDGNGIDDNDEDLDGDGLRNRDEFRAGTNPLNPDTDGDGWDDLGEVLDGSSPLDPASTPALRVVSRTVSWLNAAPETTPAGTRQTVVSEPASYLNALPDVAPDDLPRAVQSRLVSYLNAIPEPVTPGTVVHVPSLTVSYLNAEPEGPPPGTAVHLPSRVVSYQNQ